MYIINNNKEYVRATRKAKGGYVLSTTPIKEHATDFVTNAVFDALEKLNEMAPEKGWICE